MAYKLLTDCPVCSSKMRAVKLSCPVCSTVVENEFEFSRLEMLSAEQSRFVEVFLKAHGSIKEVERELGISYPTVKSKLNDVIKSLGYKVREEPKEDDITSLLNKLESGEIAPEEVVSKIKKTK